MKAATVIVDCGELERTDLSTMQTMLALKHALESEHRTMRVSNLPDSQAAAWSRIGFSL
jgi:anti-anti-sigma regulatory factor